MECVLTRNKDGKNAVLFYSERKVNGVCSNWYKSDFTVDGVHFSCVEQYMMYQKAILFKDNQIAKRIMGSTSQRDIKAMGRQVRNFEQSTWDKHKYSIVAKGVYAKFSQDKDLKAWMQSIKSCDYFVECAPHDRIWGVGMPVSRDAAEPSNWDGENLLGKALKEAYDKIKNEK